jgi:hypothetical protein
MPDQDQESKDFQIWNAYQSLDGIIEMSYDEFVDLIETLKSRMAGDKDDKCK